MVGIHINSGPQCPSLLRPPALLCPCCSGACFGNMKLPIHVVNCRANSVPNLPRLLPVRATGACFSQQAMVAPPPHESRHVGRPPWIIMHCTSKTHGAFSLSHSAAHKPTARRTTNTQPFERGANIRNFSAGFSTRKFVSRTISRTLIVSHDFSFIFSFSISCQLFSITQKRSGRECCASAAT